MTEFCWDFLPKTLTQLIISMTLGSFPSLLCMEISYGCFAVPFINSMLPIPADRWNSRVFSKKYLFLRNFLCPEIASWRYCFFTKPKSHLQDETLFWYWRKYFAQNPFSQISFFFQGFEPKTLGTPTFFYEDRAGRCLEVIQQRTSGRNLPSNKRSI